MCYDNYITLTIIASNDKVFGGYTDISWEKSGNYGASKFGSGKSFLFSL